MSQKFVHATCLISGSVVAGESHERRRCVRCARTPPPPVRRSCRARPQIHRRQQAAVERHQMRHERHLASQGLFHLRRVAMAERAVRGDAAVILGEVGAVGRRLARAGDPRLRVDHHVARGGDQPGLASGNTPAATPSDSSRGSATSRAPRIASALELGQPVRHSLRHPGRHRVPGRIGAARREGKRTRQIDDAQAGVEERRARLGRGCFGQGQKRDVRLGLHPARSSGVTSPSQIRATPGACAACSSPATRSPASATREGAARAAGPAPGRRSRSRRRWPRASARRWRRARVRERFGHGQRKSISKKE